MPSTRGFNQSLRTAREGLQRARGLAPIGQCASSVEIFGIVSCPRMRPMRRSSIRTMCDMLLPLSNGLSSAIAA